MMIRSQSLLSNSTCAASGWSAGNPSDPKQAAKDAAQKRAGQHAVMGGGGKRLGRAVQVDPIKPTLNAP